jgi:NAD(P)-dependent dehydrogenase (short-subunit alcohol dehydrogenase family)
MSVSRVALARRLGTIIEWYGFFLYGVVAPIVLAGLVAFLASNSAAFITGAVIPVDGSILAT